VDRKLNTLFGSSVGYVFIGTKTESGKNIIPSF
jgi:hypothetical protein